jgi:hypothetical protein
VDSPFVDFAAEDLDGDGDADLAGVSDGEGVLLATQEQPGTFAQGEVVSLGAGARAVAVVAADLDGDDRLDLAVGDAGGGVHVLLQSAAGTFGASPIRLAGAGVSSLAVGDVDGDGEPDLVAAHPGTDAVSVFLGPDFLPGAGADLELTDAIAGPSAVELGDLDGDGRLDLAVANETTGDVAIYLGAAGGFGTTADRVLPGPSGARATALVAADLDRDGDRDLVVGYGGIDRVGFFEQTAPGTFELAGEPVGDSASTPEPFRLVVADLDLDGAPDLVVSSPASAGTAVFLQGADGSFPSLPGLVLGAGSVGGGASGIAALDLDSDGRIDLAAANGGSQRLEVFYQSRPGDFRSESVLLDNALLGESAEFIQPGDFDGDGDLDLALADRDDDHVSLWIQTAPGLFEPSEEGPIGEGVFDAVTALAAGDLDDDGDLDLVAAMTGRSQLGLAFQTAPGVFTFDPSTDILGDFPARFRPRSVAIGDLDGDNDLDIVSANTGNGSLSVFLQTAPGVFPPSPAFNLSSGTFTQRPNVVLTVDIDADGDTDIVTANQGNKFDPDRAGISIFLQDAGSFAFGPEVSLLNLVPVTEIIDVEAGDLDGDGDLDLVAADKGAGALLVIEQTAAGDFVFDGQMLSIPGASIAPISVEVADFDGDGFLDVATVDELQNRLLVFVQSAPGRFHRDPLVDLAPLSANGVTLSIAAADLDSDGDVDLVSADSVGGAQTVHFGGR